MKLFLHTPLGARDLERYYRRAFSQALELLVVTAYLTEWDGSLRLNKQCGLFRLVIGKDFGITRKEACRSVLRWLPRNRKSQFLVADGLTGFHPKALFWKEAQGYFCIVGSSNLTRAAFETNYEANAFGRISRSQYAAARTWVSEMERYAIPVGHDWLDLYKESKRPEATRGTRRRATSGRGALVALRLPRPRGTTRWIRKRRHQLEAYIDKRSGLLRLLGVVTKQVDRVGVNCVQ